MTHHSTSDEKMQRILSAVKKLLAKKGYAKTTISLVAKKAGVSRGLLHYYFKNKDDMIIKVIRNNMEYGIELIDDIFDRSLSARDFSKEFTTRLKGLVRQNPVFFDLFFEGLAIARQNAKVSIEMESMYVRFRKTFSEKLKHSVEKGYFTPLLPVGGLVSLIIALLDGIGLQLVVMPLTIDNKELWDTVRRGVAVLLGGTQYNTESV